MKVLARAGHRMDVCTFGADQAPAGHARAYRGHASIATHAAAELFRAPGSSSGFRTVPFCGRRPSETEAAAASCSMRPPRQVAARRPK